MSRGVNSVGAHAAAGPGRLSARMTPGSAYGGIGMVEFLIALLIFSTGIMGLLAAQIAGKRASFDASQRSYATALARDILERMRANPTQLAAYEIAAVGDTGSRVPLPGADCDTAACTTEQLAAFDVWQWESLLLGASEQVGGEFSGGLVSPLACIARQGNAVTVSISWLGATPAESPTEAVCDSGTGSPAEAGGAGEGILRRRQLTLAAFIAG